MDEKLERIRGFLEILIKRNFNVEYCGGNWQEDCKDILGERCQDCCRGVELLKDLYSISDLNP